MKKELVSIEGKIKFCGHGSVNNDVSEDAKGKGNISYMKKHTGHDPITGKPYQYPFVSGTCLGHHIFEHLKFYDQTAKLIDTFKMNALTDPGYLMRGDLICNKDKEGEKRKAPFTILDAADKNTVIEIEGHSNFGDRNSNSLYFNETVGEWHPESEFYLDIKLLQFLCADNNHSNLIIPAQFVEGENKLYQKFMEKYNYEVIPRDLKIYVVNYR